MSQVVICPYPADELCRPCLLYTPCGCRASGDLEHLLAHHDGETCTRKRGHHVVLPDEPGYQPGTMFVPTRECLVRDTGLPLGVYGPDGIAITEGALPTGEYAIEAYREGGGWLRVRLAEQAMVSV